MANIIKTLKKELENNRTLISKTGEVMSYEKVKAITEKEYRKGIAKGTIALSISYADYEKEVVDGKYIHVEALLNDLAKKGIDSGTDATEEETAEPEETAEAEEK